MVPRKIPSQGFFQPELIGDPHPSERTLRIIDAHRRSRGTHHDERFAPPRRCCAKATSSRPCRASTACDIQAYECHWTARPVPDSAIDSSGVASHHECVRCQPNTVLASVTLAVLTSSCGRCSAVM